MDFVLDLRNLQQVASFVGSLPEDTEFGEWSFSQLLIHLWTWDEEMMRLLDAQMEGMIKNLRYEDLSEEDKGDMDGFFQFEYQQLGISFEAWNEMMFSRYEDLSTTQLRTNFLLGRKRLFVTYQRHIIIFSGFEGFPCFSPSHPSVTTDSIYSLLTSIFCKPVSDIRL